MPRGSEERVGNLRPRAKVWAGFRRAGLASGALATLALGAGSACAAASLTVMVTRSDGTPVPGAVVLLHGPPGSRPAPPATYVVDQVNLTFTPDLTVVPVGSSVKFPNSDAVSHQVYSFSPARRFQLPLYRGTPYAPVKFDQAGIVTLGCNIHDDMIAYLVVTDAEWSGLTEADGTWAVSNLPAGEFRVEVWHPRMREVATTLEKQLAIADATAGKLDVHLMRPLRPEPLGHKPHSWSDY